MARPPKQLLNDFIGQARVIRFLKTLVEGAKALGIAMQSMLLLARSGQGKTALAEALAGEYESAFQLILASKAVTAQTIHSQLQQLNFGDILFIDEAHSLGRDAQQALFLALDRRKAIKITEAGRVDPSTISIADFCLVLATSEPGLILPALRDRIEIVEFDPYSVLELKAIAEMVAKQEGILFTPQAARLLAERSQGSPRQIQRAVSLLRIAYPTETSFSQEDVRLFLQSRGIDDLGLLPKQREYLRALAAIPRQSASLERLACKLGIDILYLRRDVEPYLVECGFIDIATSRSRKLTSKGTLIATGVTDESPAEDKQILS